MIRTFVKEKDKTTSFRDIIQVNEETQTIKMYSQEKALGFPFDEHYTSVKDKFWLNCWGSFEQYLKFQEENFEQIEVDTDLQVKSEIAGLLNLRRHRNENNTNRRLILNDGSVLDDIVDRIKEYNYTEEEVTTLIQFSDFVDELKKNHTDSWEQYLKEDKSFTVQEKDIFLTLINAYDTRNEELVENYCYQGKSR